MGEHPPDKFVTDGHFCIWTQFIIVATAITLSSIGCTVDDGGNSDIPFFITGFILAPFHIANVISKIYVLKKVDKITKTNLLDFMTKNVVGKYMWPLTAQIGMVWCIPGLVLTGIGGLSCDTDNKNATTNTENNCYYEATSDNAPRNKGLAIGLMVCHAVSLVWFLFSSCPVKGIHDQIKNDPAPRPAPPRQTPADTTLQLRVSELDKQQKELELKERTIKLREQAQRLEIREQDIARRERELNSTVPPPPSYDAIVEFTAHGSNGETGIRMPPVSGDGKV